MADHVLWMPQRNRLQGALWGLLSVAGLGLGLACTGEANSAVEARTEAPPGPRICAVTLDAPSPPEPGLLAHLRGLGVTHLTLVAFAFQARIDQPEIRTNTDARWYSESDAGMRALAREAAALGMGVILKPHLWVGRYDAGGQTRADIGFEREADWETWEAQYHAYLLHYAHLAQEIDAALLVVGTELAKAARQRPAFWRALIADVRAVYDGELTYAANWYAEYEHLEFWDALDYIGVQGYFPLSQAEAPTAALLRAGWTPHRKALERLARRVGRPVLFTEVGYRSVHYAAAEPWRWPTREEDAVLAPDYDLQARLYQAFFETIWHDDWFAGAMLWKWHPGEARRGRSRALRFTPQGKPAEAVIGEGFRKSNAQP